MHCLFMLVVVSVQYFKIHLEHYCGKDFEGVHLVTFIKNNIVRDNKEVEFYSPNEILIEPTISLLFVVISHQLYPLKILLWSNFSQKFEYIRRIQTCITKESDFSRWCNEYKKNCIILTFIIRFKHKKNKRFNKQPSCVNLVPQLKLIIIF